MSTILENEGLYKAPDPTLFQRIADYDYSESAEIAFDFLSAHMGCMAAPFVTATVLGNTASSFANYSTSVAIGVTTMLAMDALMQKVSVDNCVRCVKSKMDGFKRQGKIITQGVMMSSMMYAGHQLTGHHHDVNEMQKDQYGITICTTKSNAISNNLQRKPQ